MPMSPRLLRPRASFDPRRFAGLDLWLDFSDRSTMTLAGSSISEIRDKSVNRFALQSTGVNQPTLTDNAINGRTAAVFNGSSTRLTVDSYTALGELSIFVVCYRNWSGGVNHCILSTNYSSASGLALVQIGITSLDFQSGDLLFFGNGFNSGRAPRAVGPISNANLTGSQPVIISGRLSNAAAEAFINGTNVSTRVAATGTPNVASATLHIGCEFVTSVGNFWDGGIAQVLIYNAVLSSAQVKQIELGLGSLYGITVAT
jgi:hypothetical protein